MDIYADALGSALESLGHSVEQTIPQSRLERFSSNRWVMRYLRYLHYPRSIHNTSVRPGCIQHVVDHGYAHLLPKLTAPVKVCNAHDLIPLLHWKGLIESSNECPSAIQVKARYVRKPRLNLHSLAFLERYDHLITISANTAKDLQTHLGISPEKISVIAPVLNPCFKPATEREVEDIREKYGLSKDRRWVMLSGREFYKNHRTALAAIKRLKDRLNIQISVVKTGWESDEFASQVAHTGLSDCTHSVFVAPEDMAGFYSTVDCLLFPSSYEGFGMPVAEALACGTPAVISNRGSLPEVAPSLLQGVDAFDDRAIADKLEEALFEPRLRHSIAEQGPIDMRQYSPEIIGGSVSDLYERLRQRSGGL